MEIKLGEYKNELKRKDVIISELEANLKTERISKRGQSQIEELQIGLSKKDSVIQNLVLEKQVLDSEVRNLRAILEKLQHAFSDMYKDKKAFISIVESHESFVSPREERSATPEEHMNRLTTYLPNDSQCNQCDTSTVVEPEKFPVFCAEEAGRSLAFGIEPACSTTRSTWLGPESTNDAQSMLSIEVKDDAEANVYTEMVMHPTRLPRSRLPREWSNHGGMMRQGCYYATSIVSDYFFRRFFILVLSI